VVTRWSERIHPDARRINSLAARRWRQIEAHERETGAPPVYWLLATDVQDPGSLRERLEVGQYTGAIGLAGRRVANPVLVEMLLRHSPVLMWPDEMDEFPVDQRSVVTERWESLPDGFAEAYRDRWKDDSTGPLCQLRAVWDDADWLAFCRSLRIAR
jgi:hypothetical protein